MLKNLKISRVWLITGIVLLFFGYVFLCLLPVTKSLYAWNKITFAPVLLIGGYICCAFAIIFSKNE